MPPYPLDLAPDISLSQWRRDVTTVRTATDQIPQRAIQEGVISRFGTLDTSDGGETHRHTLSAEMQRSGASHATKVVAYLMDYELDLFSNFTYLLNDPTVEWR